MFYKNQIVLLNQIILQEIVNMKSASDFWIVLLYDRISQTEQRGKLSGLESWVEINKFADER